MWIFLMIINPLSYQHGFRNINIYIVKLIWIFFIMNLRLLIFDFLHRSYRLHIYPMNLSFVAIKIIFSFGLLHVNVLGISFLIWFCVYLLLIHFIHRLLWYWLYWWKHELKKVLVIILFYFDFLFFRNYPINILNFLSLKILNFISYYIDLLVRKTFKIIIELLRWLNWDSSKTLFKSIIKRII